MKTPNFHLLPITHRTAIKETIVECLEKYNIFDDFTNGMFKIDKVEMSKRLKTTAGMCEWRKSIQTGVYTFTIKLAYNNYQEFGIDSMLKTLRHEMAHLIDSYLNGSSGHSERFKIICANLGGTMNRQHAGTKYASLATKDFCTTQKRYIYKCPCGMSFERKRKITGRRTLFGRCKTCRTLVMDMKIIDRQIV